MTKHALETRNEPIEIREEDQIALATRAVEDLRSASETFRTNVDAELARRDTRIAALETRLNRPGQPNGNADTGRELHRRAWDAYVRRGPEAMSLEERTVMTTGVSDGGGGPNSGYLVPPEFLAELDKNLVLFSPMRSLARILQASTGAVILPKRTAIPTVSWEGETDAEPVTNPVYANQTLSIYEMKAYVDVSNRMLEDSAFSIDGLLAEDLGEAFGQKEGAAFIVGAGSGSKQPLGITAATITTSTVAATTGPTTDELIDFYHSLPSPYAANATWLMNRSTIGYVRKLKNEAGEYMWQGPLGPLTNGNPGSLLGAPVVEFPDMPNIGAGLIPIAFGDWRSGFKIFDRVSLSVLRDPYSQQTAGNVRFHARRRVGGEVTKAEALRLLKCAAS
jgi:HK97 family phage major capsid protein